MSITTALARQSIRKADAEEPDTADAESGAAAGAGGAVEVPLASHTRPPMLSWHAARALTDANDAELMPCVF